MCHVRVHFSDRHLRAQSEFTGCAIVRLLVQEPGGDKCNTCDEPPYLQLSSPTRACRLEHVSREHHAPNKLPFKNTSWWHARTGQLNILLAIATA